MADMNRFLDAQAGMARAGLQRETYSEAIRELRAGRKRSHWAWYVFPQIRLGKTNMAIHYAITSCAEALQYLRDPVLGPRYMECVAVVAGHVLTSGHWNVHDRLEQVLGHTDARKFASSITLFGEVARLAGDEEMAPLVTVIDEFFSAGVARCESTLEFIRSSGDLL